MTLPVPDRDKALGAVRVATASWTSLLRSVTDPSRNALGVWSIADVGAHTSHIYETFPRLIRGGSSPIQNHLTMAEEWQKIVADDPERDMHRIAERIDKAAEEFIELATAEEWTSVKRWHGGLEAPTYSLAAILVNEATLHGLDVAKIEGRSWKLPREWARLAIVGLLPVLPDFLDEDAAGDLDATFKLKLRGGDPIYLTISDRGLTIDERKPPRIDCVISADPVSYLLVGYGRQSQLKPILTGKIVAYGRKPWLGLRFGKLFRSV